MGLLHELRLGAKKSLRTRLIVGMTAMLLPLLVLAAGTIVIFESLLGTFIEVSRETIEEIQPNLTLQRRMAGSHATLDHYARDGRQAAARLFIEQANAIDRSFASLVGAPFSRPKERQLVIDARRQWGLAKAAALAVTRDPNPVADARTPKRVARFEAHANKAMALLGRANAFDTREIRGELMAARAGRARNFAFIAGAFVAGLAVAIAASFLLARSILRPVSELERAVGHLSRGEFGYRVPLTREDELGRLERAFNATAQRLQIDQAALEELATRDSLTGLYSRREVLRLLDDEIERSERYSQPFSVLMLDIDRFKAVNDRYGHRAGDKVLRGVSAAVTKAVRPVDKVGRYGGEEFVIILPQTDRAGAKVTAERIRSILAHKRIPVDGTRLVSLTVSLGVAVWPDDARTDEDLVNRADEALYKAKRAGRNRVRAA